MPLHIERDAVGVVTAWLDNASKRNAMDDAMLGALADVLERLGDECGARVLVIRGRNACFCSGRDLGDLSAEPAAGDEAAASRLAPINRLARAFRSCPVPVVALVQGKAAGLGVSLACWADIAVAAADASFSIPEARAGIAPSVTAISLIGAVGLRHAVDLCLSGRSVDAATAQAIGLAQYRCDPHELERTLQDLLAMLTKGAPQALRLTKALAQRAGSLDFEASLAAANQTAAQSFASAELAEGLRARREKRAPAWQLPKGQSIQPSAALP